MGVENWSTTAIDNATADLPDINWREGQSPGSVNNSARSMMAAIAEYRDSLATAFLKSTDDSDDITEGATKLLMTVNERKRVDAAGVSVFELAGVVGDGVTDDTAALNTAIAAVTSGVLVIPPGDYVTTSKIVVANKNELNNAAQSNLQIIAYGARFISGVAAGAVAIEFDDLKYINISGLEMKVSDAVRTAGGAVASFDGLWRSNFVDCKFGDLTASFGEQNLDTFEAHYWSKFVRCDFLAHEFHTGTYASDRTETNADVFDTCYIGPRTEFGYTGPAYAISVYGDTGINGVQYINCDISYFTTALIYVDQEIAHPSAHIDFFGGFFDTSSGTAVDMKGLTVNFYLGAQSPGSIAITPGLGTGSRQTLDVYGGARNGSRLPTSSLNLIKNGDLRDGNAEITLSSGGANITATATAGSVGMFGQYVNIVATQNRTADFTSIAVPFAGVYSFSVIIRNNGDAIRSVYMLNGSNVAFDAVTIRDGEWTVVSYSTLTAVAAGDVLAIRFFGTSTYALDYDVAYVGLTYGRVGQLYAPLHPNAGTTGRTRLTSRTAAQIAAVGDLINTANKAAGVLVLDTTNSRVMCALGSAAASNWVSLADPSTTVTPA
jgi:hypothetical protein